MEATHLIHSCVVMYAPLFSDTSTPISSGCRNGTVAICLLGLDTIQQGYFPDVQPIFLLTFIPFHFISSSTMSFPP